MTEQFNLSWKEHGLNTAKTFHNLRDDDQLCDVTIACEEGVFLGHKIVLYASSLLFRSILRKHTHPHPLIYLKNISGRDMAALLDFMYFGEVKLGKEQLASFTAAAEEMKVLGLTSSTDKDVEGLSKKCSAEPKALPAAPSPKLMDWKIPTDEIIQVENQTSRTSIFLPNTQNTINKENVKFEAQLTLEAPKFEIQSEIETTESEVPVLTDSSSSSKPQQSQEQISISGQGLIKKRSHGVASTTVPPAIKEWKDLENFVIKGEKVILEGKCRRRHECKICGTVSVNKGHLLQHIEGKHFAKVLKYTCNRCGRSQGTRASAKSHIKRSCRGPSGS